MERTTPRTVSPTENSAAFCAQVPKQLAVGERNAPVFRLHGADSRQNGLPDGQSVARVADARHGQIFDADKRRHAAACVHERRRTAPDAVTRAGITSPGRRGIEQPVLRLLLNDGARQPCRGRVRALVDIGDDEAGGLAYTRQDGNLARVASATPSAQDTRQDALCDAEVEQQVVRGGAPLYDGFQNASLVLRLPQAASTLKMPAGPQYCTM